MSEYPTDPAAIYLHILQRLREFRANGSQMPHAESLQSFHALMKACEQLISENERLLQIVAVSDQIVQELEIDMTLKDIDIFNFDNQMNALQEELEKGRKEIDRLNKKLEENG